MNHVLAAALLLILGASLLEASSLEDFRNTFNDLGSDIDGRVQVLRAENSDAILTMNQKNLRLLGNYTFAAREAFYNKNVSIQVEEWLNENEDLEECFDYAYNLLNLYGWFITWDIGYCAAYANNEISADSQYHFYSHAHYIMRAGTNGRGRVMESFELYAGAEQLDFLQEESEWLEYLWSNYQKVLVDEVDSHADTAEFIAEELRGCLETVMEDVDYWLQATYNVLQTCLEDE